MCTHCITFNFTQRQESAPDRDTLQSFGQVLCQPKKLEPLPSNQLLGTSGRASGGFLTSPPGHLRIDQAPRQSRRRRFQYARPRAVGRQWSP